MKPGTIVTPIDYPKLKGVIVEIDTDSFTGEILYVLDNGCRYIESELILKSTPDDITTHDFQELDEINF